jgi:hypothetical protein
MSVIFAEKKLNNYIKNIYHCQSPGRKRTGGSIQRPGHAETVSGYCDITGGR